MNLGNVVGQTLDDKYKIEKELGRGGMGTVYLATHVGTARPVAVKVIAPEFMARIEFVERFRREARAAGRLRHPNVVNVTDFGFSKTETGEVAYLVMEYLDGCTLGEILEEENQLPLSWSIDILEQVCSAVHEAHEQGIIHRDLKPDNIWLEPNQRGGYTVKVLDFGIAKLEEAGFATSHNEISVPTTPTQIVNKHTFADENQIATLADLKNSTVISEASTIAQIVDNQPISNKNTLLSEAGTLIQNSDEVNLESGTAILPPAENPSTENIGTKLISASVLTDEPALKNLATSELTRVGAVLGTPLYMSPEQCRGEKLSKHSDIYSLGVIAYQMLSGKTPFAGDYKDVMNSHQEIEPPALDAKKIPKKVKQVIHATLSKNPAERPMTAEAFASKLRSSSEGLGTLLTRALVIYSTHLPKFLLLALVTAIPIILVTLAKVTFTFLQAFNVIEDGTLTTLTSVVLGLSTFFVQIFYAAFLVGMTTWIVAQILAVPLRPISLRAAFSQVKKRWKPLVGTVTASTLLAMVGLVFCLLPGVWLTARYMLIAPSIMMEGVSGRTAFRRSIELVRRSFRTVFATALLVYFVPPVLAIVMSVSIAAFIKTVASQTQKMGEVIETVQNKDEKSDDININIGSGSVKIDSQKDDRQSEGSKFRTKLTEGFIELFWFPIGIFISSFTSVITALLYFKTRQAGGESMSDLLEQFEDAERPRSNWQKRIRERLEQSSRLTSKT